MNLGTPDRSSDSHVSPVIPPEGVVVGPGARTNMPSSNSGSSTNGSAAPAPEGQQGTECWIHEACLVWLPGVHIVNSRLCGVNDAVIHAQDWVRATCNRSLVVGDLII